MSKKEEFPSKSTGEAGSSSDFHQRFGSSGVVKQNSPTSSMISQSSSMSTVLQPGNMERPLSIDGAGNMVGVTTGGDDPDPFKFLKAVKEKLQDKEKYETFLEVLKDCKDEGVDNSGVIARAKDLFKGHDDLLLGFNTLLWKECQKILLPKDENPIKFLPNVEGPWTYQKTRAVQPNAGMQPQIENPPSSLIQFPSGQPQIPTSAPDSSLRAHSSTSGITIIEHKSQQPHSSGEDDEPETGEDDDPETKRRYAEDEELKHILGEEWMNIFNSNHTQDERELETRYAQLEDELLYTFDSNHSEEVNSEGTGDSEDVNSEGTGDSEDVNSEGTGDSEDVNSEGTGDSEDEPKPKRRLKKAHFSEPASSHTTVRASRITVTTSKVDTSDDGYRWRKSGLKLVKGNLNPRTYFRCTAQGCRVSKHVERSETDPRALVTTYEGKHNHPPAVKSSSHDRVKAESSGNFLSFPPMPSKNLQDAISSIDFPRSPSISVDEAFTDTSEFFGRLSTSLSYSSSKDYDVVIEYERGDISNNDFVSHLRASLCRRGISVYEGFNGLDAIPECRLLIILLTSTYVPWDLLNILEQQHTENRVVYHIFYRLSPNDFVRNSKNYESFLLQDEPERWQASLKELSQMPGYTLTDKSESNLIDEIVRDAMEVLCSGEKVNMTGMHMPVEEILALLCIESLDVRSIGIWGTVGIGKTTIAEAIFRRISAQYETSIFLKDLHTQVKEKGLDAVREDFFSKVLEVDPLLFRISDIKTSFLRSRLQRKKVFVILDDVNDYRDVETCLGMLNYFGPGSRIVMTSRNRRVLELCKVDHVYEVKPLDIPKALQLLDRGTFQPVLSPEVYKALSLELVKYSNGNPQVLQFLSSSVTPWDILSHEDQQPFPIYVPGLFERSCCGLDDNERSIFLDIACFFRRMNKDSVAMLLDGCGFSAHVGFRSLVEKSLLIISHNMVDMLTFIQATGREIVRRESSDRPGDRSRLWNAEDIRDVIEYNTRTTAIEGIFLDMSKLKFDANPNIFEKMCNLRLLKLYCSKEEEKHGVSFPQGLEYLPRKLRLLHWDYYPLSSLPKSFNPENLVELNLSSSSATKLWEGKKNLEKLRKMRLSYSNQLTKIPRLSSATNLEHIDLEGCNSLLSLRQSISHLKKLVFLNLKDCLNLESIPSMVDLESLEVLNLSGCSKLENFPEISPNVKELYMGGTMIQEIPSSIKNLVLLEKLDLENSKHLKSLPTSICRLKHLETLNLSGCTSLERFPDLSRRMKCLRFLDLSRTAIQELPSSVSYLTALEELRFVDCRNLVKLPDNAWSLRFKIEFRQIDTQKFSRLWNRFQWLKKVQIS